MPRMRQSPYMLMLNESTADSLPDDVSTWLCSQEGIVALVTSSSSGPVTLQTYLKRRNDLLDLKQTHQEPEFPTRSKYVVDWDGTCVEESWPEQGDWLDGAREALRKLADDGPTVIYSLRCHLYEMDDATRRPDCDVEASVAGIRKMLDEAGLHDVRVYPPDRGKPPGKYYIDDRAVHYDGDWKRVLALIGVREAERRLA